MTFNNCNCYCIYNSNMILFTDNYYYDIND